MMDKLSARFRIRLLIVLAGTLFFCSFIGSVHLFDWDEINFAESAREMIVTGNYSTVQINFVPFLEKPPFFIWLQVLSMKVFGINEFAARFPNTICGILTLLLLFETGTKIKDEKFGLFWVIAYGASVLPFLYFKSGIIDPWFNLFIFSSLYFGYKFIDDKTQSNNRLYLFLSAISLGLAVLTKGPAALLLTGLTMLIFVIFEKKHRRIRIFDLFLWGGIAVIIGFSYHLYQIMIGNWQIIYDFFKYQITLFRTEDADHGAPFFYHPIVLLIGVFPSSLLALQTLFKKSEQKEFGLLMIILFWVVLIVFSIAKTKIVHYSSLCYYPISYLAARTIYKTSADKDYLSPVTKILLFVTGIIYAFSPLALELISSPELRPFFSQYIHDDFALACLSRNVYWNGWEFGIGILFLIFVLVSLFYEGLSRLIIIYGSTVLFVILFLVGIVPKIEAYSQGAAIEFITNLKKDEPQASVSTLNYKSYAPLFYFEKNNKACSCSDENNFLLNDPGVLHAYFIVKNTSLDEILKTYPQLKVVNTDGGFVLLKRMNFQRP